VRFAIGVTGLPFKSLEYLESQQLAPTLGF